MDTSRRRFLHHALGLLVLPSCASAAGVAASSTRPERSGSGSMQIMPKTTRYWVSWWSGAYADQGATNPPFQIWTMEHRPSRSTDWNNKARDDLALTAVIDAPNAAAIWESVRLHFPDAEPRWAEPRPDNWHPADVFPGWEDRTSLAEPRV